MVVLVSSAHFKRLEGLCVCLCTHTRTPCTSGVAPGRTLCGLFASSWGPEKHLLICKPKGSGWDCPEPVGNISGFNCAIEV